MILASLSPSSLVSQRNHHIFIYITSTCVLIQRLDTTRYSLSLSSKTTHFQFFQKSTLIFQKSQKKMQREEKTKEKMEMKEDFDVFKTENTIRLNEDGGVLKEILKSGSGSSPHEGCACDVHYVGRLSDGTVFDSSRQRKKPFRFILRRKECD